MIGPMEREWVAEESALIAAPVDRVYAAVADLRRMGRWSPECFAVWVRGGAVEVDTRFTGFNRHGWRVWFTNCEVTLAEPGQAFAFRVSSLRLPVALWGYRFEAVSDGTTRLTEYWQDLRRDYRGAGFMERIGRIFTGVASLDRAEANRKGMRATLNRIKIAVESPHGPSAP
jgi:hypothetical protein